MSAPQHDLPDVAVGRHPDHGIVAATPTQSAAAQWMLKRLEFQPIPGHANLYALTDQQREGADRAGWAVKLLRAAEYRVDTDLSLAAQGDARSHAKTHAEAIHPQPVEPDVAFAEHPRLGIVAATASTVEGVDLGGPILEAHGWAFDYDLDIYTLPATVERGEALGRVGRATRAMQETAGLRVAVQPDLALESALRRAPAPAPVRGHDSGQALTTHRFPVTAAALAKSPARAGQPGMPPVPAPAVPPAGVPDPRIAFARTR